MLLPDALLMNGTGCVCTYDLLQAVVSKIFFVFYIFFNISLSSLCFSAYEFHASIDESHYA